MKLTIIVILSFFLSVSRIIGQDPFYIDYSIDNGLPSNEVYDIEIDNNGLIWFTTDRGVSSYDSYEFKNYTTYDGLGDNVNFEIFKDVNGALWFFGYNGNITIYENGIFKPYKYNQELKELARTILGPFIKEIQQVNPNKIAVAYTRQHKVCITYLYKDKKPELQCNVNKSKSIYLDDFTFTFIKSLRNSHALFPISYNKNEQKIVNSLDLKSNINFFKRINNEVLLSTMDNSGLEYLDLETNKRDTILQKYTITDLKVDSQDNYWISTINGGVLLVPNINIKLIETAPFFESIKINYLRFHEFKNYLFCGANEGIIISINSNNKIGKTKNKSVHKNNIDQFQTINNGKKLIFHGHEITAKGKSFSLKENYISKRVVYFSNNDRAFRSYDAIDIDIYKNNTINDSIEIKLDNALTKIIEDSSTTVWIGTLGGLSKIEKFDYHKIQEIKTLQGKKLGRVSDITCDQFDNIWVSTIGNGIFLISNDGIVQFNSDDGLTTNIVNTIEVIDTNNIWVGTNNGLNLIHFDQDSNTLEFVESFNKSDGLNSNYINDIIKWNDHIYIASPNGICFFPPDKISKPNIDFPLNINSIYANDSLLSKSNFYNLTHDQDKVSINYRTVRQGKSKNQKLYKYRLEKNGQPNQWIFTNETEAIFDNLEHGNYTFEVKSINKFGEWSSQSVTSSFAIAPHYSETWWFKVLLFFILIISVILISSNLFKRYRIRKETELALEEAKTKIKEAELSALRNQMNPHFIFNSLNTIQNFIFKKDVTKANHLLSKFSSLIRRSLSYSRLESIVLQDEINFLKDYVNLEKVRFPEMINLEFKIHDSIDMEFTNIPCLLLQPLIENAIKHGISKSKNSGIITVAISPFDDNYLNVEIVNSYIKIESPKNVNTGHISLGQQIIKDRMEILRNNGYPKSKFQVSEKVERQNPIYHVLLILPKI